VLAASSGGEELSQSLLGVVIGAVRRDCGRGLVVIEGVDKLSEFLRRECWVAVGWIGGALSALGAWYFASVAMRPL
jgi:hypothetical protein